MQFFKDFIYNLTFKGLEYFGIYYSKYRAFVYDNIDPENCGRLRLIIPFIDETTPLKTWALPCGVFGGEDYGSHVLPQKGDLVWVEFEMGKLKSPIWSFSYHGKDEKPKEFDTPNTYGFKTPKGSIVVIDDKVDGKILINYKSKTTLELNDAGIEIKANGNTIMVNDGGIVIDSGDQPIFLNGNKQVLYSNIPGATEVLDLSQIGVSNKVKIG